ncbi:MAG: type II toxin-antitoxin system HigB family toxin [Burkholderiales bacterium]|nr:type II toxin-antitoxin system HigB family toxin [Burkholderiales bacterium]
MRIIAISTLRRFWQKHPTTEIPLKAWYAEARRARWDSPADLRADRRNVSILANGRAVFNIKGNDYRLVVAIRYDKQIMFVRFIGAHAEYDRIDATTV